MMVGCFLEAIAMEILVLGAGVIGLTTAIQLRRLGHDVEVWAKAISPGTTSDVAAAFWYPYAAFPIDAVSRWAKDSFAVLGEQAKITETGIVASTVSKYFEADVEPPKWKGAVSQYEEFIAEGKPGYRSAFKFSTWIVDMTIYMPYLKSLWKEIGGRVAFRPLNNFDEIPDRYSLIVNCTGLGARELVGDKALIAARGRVVRIAKFDNQPEGILLDAGDELFGMIVPRKDDVVLGGTYEENEEDRSTDDKQVEAILARCKRLCPELSRKRIEVLGTACGLRPVRSTVRLELEEVPNGRKIIHNYGHGGAGVTLAWGCAQDVAALVAKL
jgi:D-amino-acid oxidase